MPTHGQRAEKLRLSHPPRSASLWSSKAAWSRALDLLALLLLLDVRLASACTCLFLSVPVDSVQTSRYLSAYACRRTCSCTASRWSGWGCHQSVPSRTQRCLRVRPPGPRRIQVRCHLSSQPPMPPRARASRALNAPRLRCASRALYAPRLRRGAHTAPPPIHPPATDSAAEILPASSRGMLRNSPAEHGSKRLSCPACAASHRAL